MDSIEKMVSAALVRGGTFAEIARQVADTATQMRIAPSGSRGEALLQSTHVAQLTALRLALSLRAQIDEHERVLKLNLKNFEDLSEHLMLARADLNNAIDRQLKRHGLINEDT